MFGMPASVFEVTVRPVAVLARIDEGRQEAEVVVNPNRLRGFQTPRLVETVLAAK